MALALRVDPRRLLAAGAPPPAPAAVDQADAKDEESALVAGRAGRAERAVYLLPAGYEGDTHEKLRGALGDLVPQPSAVDRFWLFPGNPTAAAEIKRCKRGSGDGAPYFHARSTNAAHLLLGHPSLGLSGGAPL